MDVDGHVVTLAQTRRHRALGYDALVIGTGALRSDPDRRPGRVGPGRGVHVLHSMDDTFALDRTLERLTSLAR